MNCNFRKEIELTVTQSILTVNISTCDDKRLLEVLLPLPLCCFLLKFDKNQIG